MSSQPRAGNPFRNRLPRFAPEPREANRAVVDLLNRIAQPKGAPAAQIALVWLQAQKPWIVPIPGPTELHRLEENIESTSLRLTTEDFREISDAASQLTVQGARYPGELEKLVGL